MESVANVALVVPLHGSAGIFGPSCEFCAQLAVAEINSADGVLGRQLRLSVIDGSGSPRQSPTRSARSPRPALVDAVVGWHISAVRQAVAPRVADLVPVRLHRALRGRRAHAGRVPDRRDARRSSSCRPCEWLHREHGVRRWCIVGNDYVWPRATAAGRPRYAKLCDGQICHEAFVPLGCDGRGAACSPTSAARAPDAVIMLLVGDDAVLFNRASPPPASTRLPAAEHADRREHARGQRRREHAWHLRRGGLLRDAGDAREPRLRLALHARFGPDAPTLNSVGESCYEGVLLLSALAGGPAASTSRRMTATAEALSYSGPRGEVRMRDRHLDQRIYLAEARLQFDLVAQL